MLISRLGGGGGGGGGGGTPLWKDLGCSSYRLGVKIKISASGTA